MKLFSHRGNLSGPNLDRENSPDHIDAAITAGFDVEVDVRLHGGTTHFGHDSPQYPVAWDWILARKDRLLLHLKDLESARLFVAEPTSVLLHYFCHESDRYTLTSRGFLWVHDHTARVLSIRCIVPVKSIETAVACAQGDVYGVCSDHVETIRNWLK